MEGLGSGRSHGAFPSSRHQNLRPPESQGLGAWLTLGFKCSQPKAGGPAATCGPKLGIKAALSERGSVNGAFEAVPPEWQAWLLCFWRLRESGSARHGVSLGLGLAAGGAGVLWGGWMAKGTVCCSPGFLAQAHARPRGLFSSTSPPQPCLDLSPQGRGPLDLAGHRLPSPLLCFWARPQGTPFRVHI